MKLITLNLPQAYIDGLEKLVQEDIYPNRSEAIRLAIRDFLRREKQNSGPKPVASIPFAQNMQQLCKLL